MAEGNVASRSRHEARERIRLITEELARRSRTENLKAEAGALKDRVTAQAKAKAQEKADELKARVKDTAREKALDLKEQMMAKPVALGILGGVAGAVVGALLGRRAEDSQHYVRAGSLQTTGLESSRYDQRRAYDIEEGGAPYYGERDVVYEETTARGFADTEGESRVDELKGKVSGAVDQGKEKLSGAMDQARVKAEDLKERAHDVKERAKGAVGDVRERLGEKLPSMEGVKSRADGIVRDDPMMLAFGAIAFGAFLGLVMPLSDRERRALHGAHLKAKEGLHTGVERAQELISEKAGTLVPSLLGVKSGEKRGERREGRDLDEEREAGENLGVSANPDALEPPAIH